MTGRVLEIPALAELRKACAGQLRAEQLDGSVRPTSTRSPWPTAIVAIMLSLLMSVVQLGNEAAAAYANDVASVFEAALGPVPTRCEECAGPVQRPART